MNKRSWAAFGLIVFATLAAYVLDYVQYWIRQYYSTNFDFSLFIATIIAADLIFATILILVISQIRKHGISAWIYALVLVLGLFGVSWPFTFYYFRSILPVTSVVDTYLGITASVWIILGVVGLIKGEGQPE